MSSSASDGIVSMTDSRLVASSNWPLMPTETEIYILPDGRVVIADMPAELNELVAQLGPVEPCAIEPLTGDHASGRSSSVTTSVSPSTTGEDA